MVLQVFGWNWNGRRASCRVDSFDRRTKAPPPLQLSLQTLLLFTYLYNERAFGLGGSCGGCPMGSTYSFYGWRWNVGEEVSLPLELAVSRKEWCLVWFGLILFCFALFCFEDSLSFLFSIVLKFSMDECEINTWNLSI